MEPRIHPIKNGQTLLIRQAAVEDARAVLAYLHAISGETDYLTFGPGELEHTEADEVVFIQKCRMTGNLLFLLGLVDGAIAAHLTFTAGHRPRVRHSGEFGLAVRQAYWGLGIGSLLVDALIEWARGTGIVTKINLRVRTDNARAIALYERKGFEREGTLRRETLIEGRYYDLHWMSLLL
jgi:RimJ/RimL family protein N-acetyltransferase